MDRAHHRGNPLRKNTPNSQVIHAAQALATAAARYEEDFRAITIGWPNPGSEGLQHNWHALRGAARALIEAVEADCPSAALVIATEIGRISKS